MSRAFCITDIAHAVGFTVLSKVRLLLPLVDQAQGVQAWKDQRPLPEPDDIDLLLVTSPCSITSSLWELAQAQCSGPDFSSASPPGLTSPSLTPPLQWDPLVSISCSDFCICSVILVSELDYFLLSASPVHKLSHVPLPLWRPSGWMWAVVLFVTVLSLIC